MKLPDCTFNIDVKNGLIFKDPIKLSGVRPRQGEGRNNNTVYMSKHRNIRSPRVDFEKPAVLLIAKR